MADHKYDKETERHHDGASLFMKTNRVVSLLFVPKYGKIIAVFVLKGVERYD